MHFIVVILFASTVGCLNVEIMKILLKIYKTVWRLLCTLAAAEDVEDGNVNVYEI